jgi:anti-sigma factor ChrR (cupin superfamily)
MRMLALAALAVLAGPAGSQDKPRAALHAPDAMKWQDGPKSLPPGAKMAVLEGDPTRPGPFVMRIKLPDGYKIPPHVHPKPERVTVISGSFHLGMGDKFNARHATPLPAGSYGTWPAGMRHFVWVEGETVVQFHGEGPWQIEYLDPRDDPRRPKE